MKTLIVALVALLFAFFLGCQSSITDPVVPEPTKFVGTSEDNSIDKDWFTVQYPNAIKLDGMLFDPSHKLRFAMISGVVRYGIKRVTSTGSPAIKIEDIYKVDPNGTPPNKVFKVSLYVNAELEGGCPDHNHLWTAGKKTEFTFRENNVNQSIIYFQKSFRVQNTCCAPLDLVLKFAVKEKELKLVWMKLNLADGLAPITEEE